MPSIKLSKPISSFGDEVTAFDLREPTAKQIRKIGSPITFKADGGYDFDMERVAQYVVALAVPPVSPPAVDQIAAGDWLPMAAALIPFFMPSTPSE